MFTPKPKTRKETANRNQSDDRTVRDRDRVERRKKKEGRIIDVGTWICESRWGVVIQEGVQDCPED